MIGTRNIGCRQIIDNAFRQAATPPKYVFRSDDTPTIQGLIGAGLAYAVLPLLTLDENDPNVAILRIRPEPSARRLGIAWHPERRPTPALMPFIEAAAEICRRACRGMGNVMGRVSHAYRERVTISVTSASLSSIGLPRMLLAFCAAVTIAGISSSLSR